MLQGVTNILLVVTAVALIGMTYALNVERHRNITLREIYNQDVSKLNSQNKACLELARKDGKVLVTISNKLIKQLQENKSCRDNRDFLEQIVVRVEEHNNVLEKANITLTTQVATLNSVILSQQFVSSATNKNFFLQDVPVQPTVKKPVVKRRVYKRQVRRTIPKCVCVCKCKCKK